MIVDKKFNHLASDPALWKRYPIPAMYIALIRGLDILLKVLESPKFSKLEVLDLNSTGISPREVHRNRSSGSFHMKELQQKFMAIMKIAGTLPLKRLDFSYNSLDLSYNTIGCHSYK